MSESINQKEVEHKPKVSNSNDKNNSTNWLIRIVSIVILGYLIFSLLSPMFIGKEKQPPRKIETPDIILIALVLLFNSGLLNRLEDLGISKEGGIQAKFNQLEQEVNKNKIQIDAAQEQQLKELEKQQKSIEEIQSFMYNFLLGAKDYEKVEQLDKHSENNTNYKFYVSERVGDELRNLRDLKLIATKSGYISDIVKASKYGKRSIDLTKYVQVTPLGKKFLLTREKLQSRNQDETNNSQDISSGDEI